MDEEQISKEFGNFLSNNLDEWIKDTILKETILAAKAANLPDEFISHIKIEKEGSQYSLVNDWMGEDGQPFALWFNDGVPPFKISSTGEWPLHAQPKSGSDFYISTKNKPVNHPGFPETKPMQNGYSLGSKKLEIKIKTEMIKFSKNMEAKYKVKVKVR